jgi:acetyl esterase
MNLEPTTRKFLEGQQALGGPPLHQRPVADARKFLDDAQAEPGKMAAARIERRQVGKLDLVIVRPEGAGGELPVLLYLHGGGWILGDWQTHQRLVRELACAIPAVVVFVDYERSPEARFPLALEQAYAALRWVADHADELEADLDRLAVVGDSVGGDLAAALALKAKQQGGPAIARLVMFYPVTDANFETGSYREFAEGTNLTRDAMRWFWDAYLPEVERRQDPLAAPLQASLEQLRGLPPALLIVAENDVLRDEGEAFAHKLAEAGVEVTAARYLGTVHDFVMLNALADTPAAKGAVSQAVEWLREAFKLEFKPGAVTFVPDLEAELAEGWEAGYV